jgi:hypothetical protein
MDGTTKKLPDNEWLPQVLRDELERTVRRAAMFAGVRISRACALNADGSGLEARAFAVSAPPACPRTAVRFRRDRF